MLGLATRMAGAQPRQATGRFSTFPAPVGGLNLRDSIADMDVKDALILDNYFPDSNFISLRNGSAAHVTGITGDVDTLMEWAGPATRKLFAANASAIYDVTSAGAVGAAVQSALTNGRWSHTMQATSGGNFLCLCNGVDDYRTYDGTTWATPAITGIAGTSLNCMALYGTRLWFVENDSTSAWYLGTNAISGAATELLLGAEFKLGGKLQTIGTLSRDSGSGSDDLIAFISSRGEILVYQGSDPSSLDTWALVGRFRAGAPIGNRAILSVAGDLGLISQDGVVSVLQMMANDRSTSYKAAITNKIDDAFADAYTSYGSNFGWQAIAYPAAHYAIVNIPVSATESWQYVMNTQTGAWCRFKGMNAKCWSLLGDSLYFGITGGVNKADTGYGDSGANITGDIGGAYQYFGQAGVNKHFKLIRPMIVSNGNPAVAVRLTVDFQDVTPSADDIFQATAVSASLWDTALWDTGVWVGSAEVYRNWYSTYGLGVCAAIRVRTMTNNVAVRFNSFDCVYERAGMSL